MNARKFFYYEAWAHLYTHDVSRGKMSGYHVDGKMFGHPHLVKQRQLKSQ